MLQMNEQNDDDNPPSQTSPPNLQKMSLISSNRSRFLSLVHVSMAITSMRIILFFIIITNDGVFICQQAGSNYSDSWNVIFYILASMMDCLVMLNDWQIKWYLRREEPALDKVKKELASNNHDIPETAIGKYTIYLSIHQIIRNYKFRAKSMASISHTIRYLQLIITFYTFGNLALNAQNRNNASLFKQVVLWVYMLSIYFNVFELDFLTLETSQGEFVDSKMVGFQGEQGQGQERGQFLKIKENYIKRIRRPFQIVYILTILVLLAIMCLFYQNSLLSLIMILCILSHMCELIYEKYLQNRLILMNLALIPKKHLTPYLILYELTKGSQQLHLFLCISNRMLIVMTLMAYFRSVSLEVPESFMFFFLNLLFFLGQKMKFNRADYGKIYLLRSTRIESSSESGVQCSICLVNCNLGDRIIQLPCFNNHRFHFTCMGNWFKQRKECPLCRQSLDIYDLIL